MVIPGADFFMSHHSGPLVTCVVTVVEARSVIHDVDISCPIIHVNWLHMLSQ